MSTAARTCIQTVALGLLLYASSFLLTGGVAQAASLDKSQPDPADAVTITSHGEQFDATANDQRRDGTSPSAGGTGPIFSPGQSPEPPPGRLQPIRPPGDDFAAQSVIGEDTRQPVLNTTIFPYTAITFVASTFSGGTGACSGWMISADTVATAGHCIHEGPGGDFATAVEVYPGRSGSYLPFGSCTASTLYTVSGWAEDGYVGYDYGAIKLDCTVGNSTGYFGFQTTPVDFAALRRSSAIQRIRVPSQASGVIADPLQHSPPEGSTPTRSTLPRDRVGRRSSPTALSVVPSVAWRSMPTAQGPILSTQVPA